MTGTVIRVEKAGDEPMPYTSVVPIYVSSPVHTAVTSIELDESNDALDEMKS